MRLINGVEPTSGFTSKERRAARLSPSSACDGRGDGRAPRRVVEHDEVAVERVDDHRAGLEAHEHAAEVVPRAVGVAAAVDVGVEAPAGDGAQVERRRPERPVLLPAEVPRRVARQPDESSVPSRVAADGADRLAVPRRAAAPHGLEPLARREVDDQRGRAAPRRRRRTGSSRTRGSRASALVEPSSGSTTTTMSRSALVQTRSPRDSTPTPAPSEHAERGRVGGQVAVVLTWCAPSPASPQSVTSPSAADHGGCRRVEQRSRAQRR